MIMRSVLEKYGPVTYEDSAAAKNPLPPLPLSH